MGGMRSVWDRLQSFRRSQSRLEPQTFNEGCNDRQLSILNFPPYPAEAF